ncbi:MAG: IS66 family insertion sequence element accessory protein TnpB [Gemmatimonadota bacterium]|nr:MAG: IS66 family insertion sequence element accessory protein TnpB [Gemmatimonadota bacterium]
MLSLPPSVRIFVACGATDLRRSFDTLSVLVKDVLRQDPFSGHLFAFFNRRRDRVKLLVWDRTGFWLFYKRLEEGTFTLPGPGSRVELSVRDLLLVLEGIDLREVRQRRRYRGQVPAALDLSS